VTERISGAIQQLVREASLEQEQEHELLAHDRKIRELGALAIHIVEVYDIAGSRKARRVCGSAPACKR
jgi:hypothetical protein